MKRPAAICTLFTATFLALVVVQGAPPFQLLRHSEPQLNWQTNLQAAHKLATAQNKPMLLVFGADWCHYCKKLEKETLNSQEIATYVNDSFVPIHLDVDKDKQVAQILKVGSLPCTIVLSPHADLLGRIEGFQAIAPYHKQLSTAQERYRIVQRTENMEKSIER